MKPDQDNFKLATAVVGLLLAFIAVLPSLVTHTAREANTRLESSTRVVQLYESLLTLLRDAETAQRGYLITGNEEFLTPYHAAVKSYPEIRAQLKMRAREMRNTTEILYLSDVRLWELAETIKLRQEKGFEEAAAAVSSGVGQHSMDSLRFMIEEQTRKSSRQQRWLQGRITTELEQAANVAFSSTAINLVLLASLLAMTFKALKDLQVPIAMAPEATYASTEAAGAESSVSEIDVQPTRSVETIVKPTSRRRKKHLPTVLDLPDNNEASRLISA